MFHFKKFSIDDSTAAMKIGTDAVLLGAWTPCENETRILDIGTGSGILALMMAQRNIKTVIDAVEIDPDAASLAHQNIQLSPWPDLIHIFNSSIQKFSTGTENKYSLVISNPPFFTDSLKAPGKARTMARHNDILPVTELLECTSDLLTDNGNAAFIIPADAFEDWKQKAAKLKLYPKNITSVKSSPGHKAHRVLVEFTRNEKPAVIENEMSIYIYRSVYSLEYQQLTKDFYLNF
jgi:tRNA1Val (adenine37-N6)-methyltransferase